eukprot:1159656-Pelagomonas_calceolata.AAC.5
MQGGQLLLSSGRDGAYTISFMRFAVAIWQCKAQLGECDLRLRFSCNIHGPLSLLSQLELPRTSQSPAAEPVQSPWPGLPSWP